jgi:hypothetical protein
MQKHEWLIQIILALVNKFVSFLQSIYNPFVFIQIPASFIKPIKISGLDPDLKYVFSLALYDINGQLIGESVSESTEPILAAHPISLLFIRCLLSQVCLIFISLFM